MSEQWEVVAKVIPIHQWTHDGDKVLLVKCVPKGGKSTNDFQWPKSGPVESPNWSREPTCDSGGLFGWPWGVGIGGGKDPDYQGDWIVFAAKPEDVIDLGDKAKANSAEVIYYGDWWGALLKIDAGRMAWTIQAADGNAAATGERGSAAATGGSSIAAATNHQSTVEAGLGGIAATTSENAYWTVRAGAVFIQRWKAENGTYAKAVFDAADFEADIGKTLHIVRGEIQRNEGGNP